MKKLKFLFFAILISIFSSCNKTDDPVNESLYYDQDENCDTTTTGTCCDVDGRFLVEPGKSYNYTYKVYKSQTSKKINWTVVSGDIEIISGQGTNEATFRFGKNFTTGKISGSGNQGGYEDYCENTLDISKL